MKLVAAIAEVDFESDEFTFNSNSTAEVEITDVSQGPFNMALNFTANSEENLMVVFGIDFYQSVNGELYAMKNGGYNCLAVVAIDKFVAQVDN